MISKVLYTVTLVFATFFLFGQGQDAQLNMKIMKENAWKKNLESYPSHEAFFQNEKGNLGIAKAEDFKYAKAVQTNGGWKHTK